MTVKPQSRTGRQILETCDRLQMRSKYLLKQKPTISSESKVHPKTSHAGPEGVYKYNSTVSLASALDEGWILNAKRRPLYPCVD